MTEAEALRLLDNIVAQVALKRDDHGKLIDAVQVLQKALMELAGLRQKVASAADVLEAVG